MITAKNVTVLRAARQVLSNVSFKLKRREILGVIGLPESGKTSLLKTVAGLWPIKQGEIWADEERVDNLKDKYVWQNRIGMAFQNDALFDSLTVYDNVAFPLRRRKVTEAVIETKVLDSLSAVSLVDVKDQLPDELSGGMRKRVGIARATVIEPELGLFDEPIAGLDPVSAGRILELIVGLTQALAMATMVVSNDLPALLPVVDRVLMLSAGRIVFDGLPRQLLVSHVPEVGQFVAGIELELV